MTSPGSRIADFLELAKPRLNSLVVITAGVGYVAAGADPFDPVTFAHTALGAALVAGGAAALNQIAEQDLDRRMLRTHDRPMPTGRLQRHEALWFAAVLVCVGLLQLGFGATLTAAGLALATLVSYVAIYTPLKRRTHWAVLVGAVPGGLPVTIGWAAAQPLSAAAWSLFALVFVWQLPHFLALTWLYREDFANAELPLLSVTDPTGNRAARHLVAYSALLVPVSIAPVWLGLAGAGYTIGVSLLGIILLILAIRFAMARSTDRAQLVFRATLLYLPLVWICLLLDRT